MGSGARGKTATRSCCPCLGGECLDLGRKMLDLALSAPQGLHLAAQSLNLSRESA